MFKLIYNIFSVFGLLVFYAGSVVFPRWKSLLASRKAAKTPPLVPPIKVWFHCSSLGEYEMVVPLIRKAIKKFGTEHILITFFSDSGYSYASNKEFSQNITYLPFDTPRMVQKFYSTYQPETAILVRYDLWYNLVRMGMKRGTAFYLLNARFNENHFLFKWYAKPYQTLLKRFRFLFLSDQSSLVTLKSAGFSNARYAGDTRFDVFKEKVESAPSYSKIERFIDGKPTLILGSSWEQEETILDKALKQGLPNLKIIIAPHQINRSQEIADRFKKQKPVFYSEFENQESNMLIINNIGILSNLYRYSQFAFIGGGFTGKLHNTIEPAVWGNLIGYGPKISKFSEAQSFVEQGFGFVIHTGDDLKQWIVPYLSQPELIEHKKQVAVDYVRLNLGANEIISTELKL